MRLDYAYDKKCDVIANYLNGALLNCGQSAFQRVKTRII
jgi:hypothetical protein